MNQEISASASGLRGEADWPRARLDSDYRARDCVTPEEFNRILNEYRRYSLAALESVETRSDLSYDFASPEKLNLYAAGRGSLRPVVVFMHGGYWRALSRDDSAFMAPMFASFGIATAVPDYTLAPTVGLTEIVRQMRASIAWLWHNGPDLGIDRNRILVAGSSAGGHLAAAMTMPGWEAGFGLPDAVVQAVLPISGLFELAPIASSHVQEWIALTSQEVNLLSPLRHPPKGRKKITVVVAETEAAGFHRQSLAYAQLLEAPHVIIRGRNHFDVILDLMDGGSALSKAALRLLS